jgi:hypothetical protein
MNKARKYESLQRQFQRLSRKLEKKVEDVSEEVAVVLEEAAYRIINTAVTLAPMDTGALIESAYVKRDDDHSGGGYSLRGNIMNGTNISVGFSADYAVPVHEKWAGPGETYLNPTTPNTYPKFLEKAYKEVSKDIDDIVETAVIQGLRRRR